MAKLTVSATLAATQLPLLSRHTKQPILVGKYDVNYNKQVSSNAQDEDRETTIPTLIYGDNILPTPYGYKSAAYQEVLEEISPTAEIKCLHPLALSTGEVYIYAYVVDTGTPANTGHWIVEYDNINQSAVWTQLDAEEITFLGDGELITSAIVDGRAFIFFEATKCKEIVSGAINDATLTGLTVTSVIGIFSSSGYLCAWTADAIHNASLDDPVDFTVSSVTGANMVQVQEARGKIIFCKDTGSGFVLYTDLNAVYAQYSNDFRQPFIYKKVENSAGIASANDVFAGEATDHYVRTGAIFAKITKTKLSAVLTELNASFAAGLLEEFNPATYQLEEVAIKAVDTKLSYLNSGLLIISYKASEDTIFNKAYYYNAELNRFGKLSIPHSFSIFWPFDTVWLYYRVNDLELLTVTDLDMSLVSDYGTLGEYPIQHNSIISFFSSTGSAKILLDAVNTAGAEAVLILGPFQLLRDNQVQLTRVVLKNAEATDLNCAVLTSYSGESLDSVAFFAASQQGKLANYAGRVTGYNHSICLEGAFDLSSILLELVPRGKVRFTRNG